MYGRFELFAAIELAVLIAEAAQFGADDMYLPFEVADKGVVIHIQRYYPQKAGDTCDDADDCGRGLLWQPYVAENGGDENSGQSYPAKAFPFLYVFVQQGLCLL